MKEAEVMEAIVMVALVVMVVVDTVVVILVIVTITLVAAVVVAELAMAVDMVDAVVVGVVSRTGTTIHQKVVVAFNLILTFY